MPNFVKKTQSHFSLHALVSAMRCLGLIGVTTATISGAQAAPKTTSIDTKTMPAAIEPGQAAIKKIYKTQVQTRADSTDILVQFDAFPPKPVITQSVINGQPLIKVDFGLVNYNESSIDKLMTPQLKGYRLYRDTNNHIILEAAVNHIARFDSTVDKGTFILRLFANTVGQHRYSQITDLMFMQNADGLSGMRVTLPTADSSVNIEKRNNGLAVYFNNAVLSESATKETYMDNGAGLMYAAKSYNRNGVGIIEFASKKPFTHRINRSGKVLTIEFSQPPIAVPRTPAVKAMPLKNRGKLVSMDFQDVDTRRILQVLASYTGTNIVASDAIKGTISIKLDQVPWEQALRVILTSANLVQRTDGDIILVSPADELVRREADALKLEAQNTDLVPTQTAYIQLNYAVAADVEKLIKDAGRTNNNGVVNNALTKDQLNANIGNTGSLLSPRGSLSVDNRTNTIIINDTPQKISLIQDLVKKLDIPVRQVMVEAKIVHANDDFSKALGVRWGVNHTGNTPISGSLETLDSKNKPTNGNFGAIPIALDLARSVASMGTSGIAFGLINTSSTLLGLQLAALQSDGRGEVLSAPRVLTGDKQTATIRSGAKVPYQTTSDNNGTTTTFQDAVLELNVTPSITPDGNVQMKLSISKDSLGVLTDAGYVINTNTLDTNVLVGSGETVVLGGFYENTRTSDTAKVPGLGNAPAVGKLFRSQHNEDRKQELLIFITPQIVEPQALVK